MNIPPHRQLLTDEFLISRYMCNQMVMRIKSIFRSDHWSIDINSSYKLTVNFHDGVILPQPPESFSL